MFQDGSEQSICLFLGAHSPNPPDKPANSASGDPKKTDKPGKQGKNPSRCLTPNHSIKGGIHKPQKASLPPAPYFGEVGSQQAGPMQFSLTTEVRNAYCSERNRIVSLHPKRFHVLFHFLFKVLFIFPSRYLFAIGLQRIFSFRRNIPPALCYSPK